MTILYELTDEPELDEDGLMLYPDLWSRKIAIAMASHLGIGELTQEHWNVIHALRDYYREFGVAPAMNVICRKQGLNRQRVHKLFTTCLNAWRIAGLPNPGEEAKSYLDSM